MSVKFDSGGSRRRKNPGFAAAIGLCLAAVCLVAAATVINNRTGNAQNDDYISDYVSEESGEVWLGAENTGEDDEVFIDTQPAMTGTDTDAGDDAAAQAVQDSDTCTDAAQDVMAQSGDSPSVPTDDLAIGEDDSEAVAVSAAVNYRMPLAGEVIKGFSGDELVYCSTMGDWRVHQGVDISGTPDCEVYACSDGVVVDFCEDMLYGYTAIIEQEDGTALYYCGLSSAACVTPGLLVSAGDVIGYLGVVPCEAEQPPHLHLAMMKNGAFVDPIKAMGM